METKSIVVLDFGAQYSQLIARRIRENKVFSVVLPFNATLDEIRSYSPVGIILSGGPSSVYDKGAPHADKRVFDLGLPVLGICYGLQFMVYALGGKVTPAAKREYGHAKVEMQVADSQLFHGLPKLLAVWMSHGDSAEELPAGFRLTAKTPHAVAAIENPERKMWAVQFHPEVHHTPARRRHSSQLCLEHLRRATNLDRPALYRCHHRAGQAAGRERSSHLRPLRRRGFLRSSRAGRSRHARCYRQKSRLTCVFVNNGVLRKNEFEKVQKNLRDNLGLHLVAVDATDRFMAKLAGVTDPEKKRKIIGNEFIEVFDDEAHRILQTEGHVEWLVQGTLYPDVIESRSVRGPSEIIKSHHNVGGLPEKMKLKLIEPLKDLFKDEVRRIGRDLGMPEEILQRQPFPGPGLAVRILGEVTRDRVALLQDCDEIVVGEIKKAGLYQKIWQSFAVLLPVMSVGVMGDQRTYAYTCAIRAVHSEDGMTADWVPLPYEVLKTISNRIVNEVRGVNRVVYDITSKPPGTIEWE